MSSNSRLVSLSARVGLATAVCAAAVAMIVATFAWVLADQLVDRAESRRLEEEALIALNELPLSGGDNAIREAIENEARELAPTSIRIAVYRDGRFLGGDASLHAPTTGCSTREEHRITVRACTTSMNSIRIVTGAARANRAPGTFLAGCGAAIALAGVAAAIAGRQAAHWALTPLTRLGDSLAAVTAEEPDISILRDSDGCTEVRALRVALSALVTRLGVAMDRTRRFSADAAHELRTPLTTLAAELDLLSEEPLAEPARAAVERLRRRIGELSRLVERLLTLATARELGASELDPVALEDVAREVIAGLPPDRKARIVFVAHAPGMLRGDEPLLTSLTENAIDNALKFSTTGAVTVSIEEAGESVFLRVVDDGPGISARDRERAFEPFFRTAGARQTTTSGHGIGLALVAHVAAAHDGHAEFLETERGAHLRIRFPAWRPLAA